MKKLLFALAIVFLFLSLFMAKTENMPIALVSANMLIIPFFIGMTIPVIKTRPVSLLLMFILTLDLIMGFWYITPVIAFLFGFFIIKMIYHIEHPRQSYHY